MITSCAVIGLEFLALFLAWLQSLGGVRTDEAKILLNIPYPHPPLLRWIVNQTEFLPFQEMLWRLLLASIVVQAVWLVWKAGAGLARGSRLLACVSWLCSGAVLLQTGTITTAPLIAVFGLFLVSIVLQLENDSSTKKLPGAYFLFVVWLAALFTAYQAVLYLPLLVAILLRLRVSRPSLFFIVDAPLFLVMLYVLSNPLSLDRFVDASTLNVGKNLFQKFADLGDVLMIAGSGIGALTGVYGMARARSAPLLFSFLLICAFVFLSFRSYYAILFTPLFIGGIILLLREYPQWWKRIGVAYILALIFLYPFPVGLPPSPARQVMQALTKARVEGDILINGSFGHEWQYESTLPIRKYRPEFLKDTSAAVCLDVCEGIGDPWQKLQGVSVDVWVQ